MQVGQTGRPIALGGLVIAPRSLCLASVPRRLGRLPSSISAVAIQRTGRNRSAGRGPKQLPLNRAVMEATSHNTAKATSNLVERFTSIDVSIVQASRSKKKAALAR